MKETPIIKRERKEERKESLEPLVSFIPPLQSFYSPIIS